MSPESIILSALGINPDKLFESDTLLYHKDDDKPFAHLHMAHDKAVLHVGKDIHTEDIRHKMELD